MIQNDTQKASKNIRNFVCDVCDYSCSKKGDWKRHILRPKHIKLTNMIQQDTENDSKDIDTLNQYMCNCGNTYKHHSGLWRHKKQCTYQDSKMETTNVAHSDEINELKEFMKYLMQENSEMKNMMMEVIKNGTNTNSHNTISTNSHNKAAL
jgi:predicted metal-binding transcription factor (methanogenesis marker protein 9)